MKPTIAKPLFLKLPNFNAKKFFSRYVMECILIVLILSLTFGTEGFFNTTNLLNILRNMATYGVIAFGMTMVIITAEIDLSIGSTIALSGVIVAKSCEILSNQGMSMEYAAIIGIVLALVSAAIIGLFIGYLLTVIKMPSFIITLSLQFILYGVAALICKAFPLTTLPRWYNIIGAGQIFGVIPVPDIVLVIVFLITFVLMNYTKFGRSVYAVGGNPESARLSGINVAFVKTATMVIVQVCSAIGGILLSSLVMSANQMFGKGYEMIVISSCIIGGTSLFGGIGKIWGTFIGLIFLGVINNGMTLLNVNEYMQYVVRGGLTLFAVLINTLQTRQKA